MSSKFGSLVNKVVKNIGEKFDEINFSEVKNILKGRGLANSSVDEATKVVGEVLENRKGIASVFENAVSLGSSGNEIFVPKGGSTHKSFNRMVHNKNINPDEAIKKIVNQNELKSVGKSVEKEAFEKERDALIKSNRKRTEDLRGKIEERSRRHLEEEPKRKLEEEAKRKLEEEAKLKLEEDLSEQWDNIKADVERLGGGTDKEGYEAYKKSIEDAKKKASDAGFKFDDEQASAIAEPSERAKKIKAQKEALKKREESRRKEIEREIKENYSDSTRSQLANEIADEIEARGGFVGTENIERDIAFKKREEFRSFTDRDFKKRKHNEKVDYKRFKTNKEHKEAFEAWKNGDYENTIIKELLENKQGLRHEDITEEMLNNFRLDAIAGANGELSFTETMGYYKIPQKATGAVGTLWLVNKLASSKGQQSNAQLYGQQGY